MELLPLGTQYLTSRTPCEIVPGVELEATRRDYLAWSGFRLGRNDAFDAPVFQRAENLGICISGVHCNGPDRMAGRRGDRIESASDRPAFILLPCGDFDIDDDASQVVNGSMLFIGRFQAAIATVRRHSRIGIGRANLLRFACSPSVLVNLLEVGRLHRRNMSDSQRIPTDMRTDQRCINMDNLAGRDLRRNASFDRALEYPAKPFCAPALTDTCQARMIRQPLVQAIPDKPPDSQIYLRFAHEATVVNVTHKKARQHQPNRHFGVDTRTTHVRAVAIRHLLAKPTQIQNTVHTDQDVILRQQFLQCTGHEQIHLFAPLASQHLLSLLAGAVYTYTRSQYADFFNSPIVHLIRNSMSFVAWKDRRKVMPDLKAVYRAETLEAAAARLDEFESRWGERYPAVAPAWRRAWEHVVPMFAFPPAIRKMIYTTNALESLHRSLRKIIKTRGSFPSDEAAAKLLFLAIRNAGIRWRRPVDWTAAKGQFAILFEDRFPGSAS